MSFVLAQALLLQEMKKVFSYRVNFWLQYVFQLIAEIGVAYFLWTAIFVSTGSDNIGGYDLAGMINYYVFVALLGRLIRGREAFSVSTDIYEGGLTKFLVFPANYFFFKLTEHLAFMTLSLFQLLLGLLCFILIFDFNASAFLTFSGLTMGLGLGVLASLFYFALLCTIELVAFWADNVWSLTVMTRFILGFFGGLLLPITLFPEWAQDLLYYTPFPAMASMPIRLLTGELGFNEFLSGVLTLSVWSIPLALIMFLVWRRGIYQYTGVGQ